MLMSLPTMKTMQTEVMTMTRSIRSRIRRTDLFFFGWALIIFCLAAVFFILLTSGCGAPDEDAQQTEFVDYEQGMSAKRYAGWRNEDGWDHGRCDLHSLTNVCAYPSPNLNGQGLWKLYINFPIESQPQPAGFSLVTARQYTLGWINAATNNWDLIQSSQGSSSKLIIVNDDSIYSGTPPNATIDLSSIAHVACVAYGPTMIETWNGQAFQCNQLEVDFDFSSFQAWVNQWATSTNQKQLALDSVYMHFAGVALSLGSTSSTDTAMRKRLSRAQSPIVFSSYEICLANSINFADTNFVDPYLGVYTNDCN